MLKLPERRDIKALTIFVSLLLFTIAIMGNSPCSASSITCKYTSNAPTSASQGSLCTGNAPTTCCTSSMESYLIVVARTQSATTSSKCSSMLQQYFCAGCIESNQQYFASQDNPNIPMQYVTPCKSHCNKMKEICVGDYAEIKALKNLDCSTLPESNCWSA